MSRFGPGSEARKGPQGALRRAKKRYSRIAYFVDDRRGNRRILTEHRKDNGMRVRITPHGFDHPRHFSDRKLRVGKDDGHQNASALWIGHQALSLIHISEPTRRTPISY